MSLAKAFKTDRIWILNIGDLKNHEIPLDHFLTLGYDFERWGKRNSVHEYLRHWAAREFNDDVAEEIASIMSLYGVSGSTISYSFG